MRKILFYVDVLDKEGNRYRDSEFKKVLEFEFREEFNDGAGDDTFERECRRYYRRFKAISPESNISVEVRDYNSFTQTWPLLYSFYGAENRFVKHD